MTDLQERLNYISRRTDDLRAEWKAQNFGTPNSGKALDDLAYMIGYLADIMRKHLGSTER